MFYVIHEFEYQIESIVGQESVVLLAASEALQDTEQFQKAFI